MTSPVNCFQTMVWIQFAVTVHGYVTKHTYNIICLEQVDNSEHKNHENKILIKLVVINQTEIVKLASGIFFCLLSGTSYLSEPTSTEARTADKLFISHFSELLAALWTSNWTLIFNANTRPVFSRTIQPHLSGSLNPVGFGFSSPFPGYVDYLPYRTIPKSVDFRQELEPCTGNTHPILLSMRFLGIMASIALREFANFSSEICFGIPRIYSNPLFGI